LFKETNTKFQFNTKVLIFKEQNWANRVRVLVYAHSFSFCCCCWILYTTKKIFEQKSWILYIRFLFFSLFSCQIFSLRNEVDSTTRLYLTCLLFLFNTLYTKLNICALFKKLIQNIARLVDTLLIWLYLFSLSKFIFEKDAVFLKTYKLYTLMNIHITLILIHKMLILLSDLCFIAFLH